MKTFFDWQKIVESSTSGGLAALVGDVRLLIECRVEQVYLVENRTVLVEEIGESEYLAALDKIEAVLATEAYRGSVGSPSCNMEVLIQSLASASNEKYRNRYIKSRGQNNYHDLIKELSAAILKEYLS